MAISVTNSKELLGVVYKNSTLFLVGSFIWSANKIDLSWWCYDTFIKDWYFSNHCKFHCLPLNIIIIELVDVQKFELIRFWHKVMQVLTISSIEIILLAYSKSLTADSFKPIPKIRLSINLIYSLISITSWWDIKVILF